MTSVTDLPAFPGTLDDIKQTVLQEAAFRDKVQADLHGQRTPTVQCGPAPFDTDITVSSPYKFDPFLGIDNLVDVWYMINPDTKLYPWQYEELMRISGYLDGKKSGPRVHWTPESPLMANYVCCNDAGKDMVLNTTVAIGLPLLYRNVIVVITSASHMQLKQQTQAHIERAIKALNARCGTRIYNSVEFYHSCPERGGEINLFCTDEPGRAEGWHPRSKDGRLVIIKNEDKSIPEAIQIALERCHGYSHWLNVSSPGPRQGKFFRTFKMADKYPERPFPFRFWARRVDWTQCPHIPPRLFELKVQEHGLNSYFIQTSFLANFYEQETDSAVPLSLLLNTDHLRFRPDLLDIGIGLDSAAGGDETCLYVRFGPVPTRSLFFREKNTTKAANRIHEFLLDLRSPDGSCNNIKFNLDDNGMSRTFGDTLERLKWPLFRRCAQSKSTKPQKFVNLGAEMYWHTRELHERGQIQTPVDELTRTQLTTREYDETTHFGKKILKTKTECKASGFDSPDRADAWVNCFFSFRPTRLSVPTQTSEPDPNAKRIITLEELQESLERDPKYLDKLIQQNRKPGPGRAYTLLRQNSIQ